MKLRLKTQYKIIGLFFLVAIVISLSLISVFDETFDQELWHSNPSERYKMVDDILENNHFIDKTKEEIFSLLGAPESDVFVGDNAFLYRLGKSPSFFESKQNQLLIVFQNGKVAKVSLATK